MATLTEFLEESKSLLDFTRCICMVTQYKENKFNFRYYSNQLGEFEKKMKSDDLVAKVFTLATDKYFDGVNIAEAVEAAINEIHQETGQDPRGLLRKLVQK